MILAEAARRENLRTVNDNLASDTSSRKQTQIVSALPASISVSAPETRALNPSRFSASATISAAQSSSRPSPGMQKTGLPSLRASMLTIFPFLAGASALAVVSVRVVRRQLEAAEHGHRVGEAVGLDAVLAARPSRRQALALRVREPGVLR